MGRAQSVTGFSVWRLIRRLEFLVNWAFILTIKPPPERIFLLDEVPNQAIVVLVTSIE